MDNETILRSFHRQHSGASQRVFGRGRLDDGRTSYEQLADVVEPPGRVLDLGCGDGPLAAVLASRGHEVLGLDMSPEEVALARERLGNAATFIEGTAHALPFDEGSFDAVLTHMALMLMDDVERVVDEIGRVLRPRGVFGAIVGRHDRVDGSQASFFREVRASMIRDGVEPRFGDARTLDVDGLRSLFGAPRFGAAQDEELRQNESPAKHVHAATERTSAA